MSNKFDELAKGLAQSVTRRQALKRFGVGRAGMTLACFGLANRAQADKPPCPTICICGTKCNTLVPKHCPNYADCVIYCGCV